MKWRWHSKDFGFRFSVGGRSAQDFYEGPADGDYYAVPKRHRKVEKETIALYYNGAQPPGGFRTVACPWKDYDRHWDEVVDADGWPLNYAGCLDHDEVCRQEDLGVARAWEFVSGLRDDTPLTVELVRDVHRELMGEIYPFAADKDALCRFVAEVLNEILAIHPFRERNGRAARVVGSLFFLQRPAADR